MTNDMTQPIVDFLERFSAALGVQSTVNVEETADGPRLNLDGEEVEILPVLHQSVITDDRPGQGFQVLGDGKVRVQGLCKVPIQDAVRHVDRIEAEPPHALVVALHMGLADQGNAVAERPQVVAERQLGRPQRHRIIGGAVARHVTAGIEGHARRPADRRLAIGAFEQHAALRQRIDMRGLQGRMAGAGQVIGAQLVGHDEKDVADLTHRRAPCLPPSCGRQI